MNNNKARMLYEEINLYAGDHASFNKMYKASIKIKSILEKKPDRQLLYDLAFNCKSRGMRMWALPLIVNTVYELEPLEKAADEYRFAGSELTTKAVYSAVQNQLEKCTAMLAGTSDDNEVLYKIASMPYGASFDTRKTAISRINNKELLKKIIEQNPTPLGSAAKEKLNKL